MTEFKTQVGGGVYRLQFETDDKGNFLLMEKAARGCIDGTHALAEMQEFLLRAELAGAKALLESVTAERDAAIHDVVDMLKYAFGNHLCVYCGKYGKCNKVCRPEWRGADGVCAGE